MKQSAKFAQELIDFCYASPTAFHAVSETKKLLKKAKFKELEERDAWSLKVGGRYFLSRNDSALLAFVIGTDPVEKSGFRIVGAHTDSPGFRIKPAAEMMTEGRYLRLNTEVYGGPILSTWFDRPLGIAGRVVVSGKNLMKPEVKLVNIDRPVCVIPNIAIHMNPDANNGFVPNKQNDTLPFLGLLEQKLEKDNFLLNLLARESGFKAADIVDFDLFLYEYGKGCLMGVNQELISSCRIDDLEAVHAGITALIGLEKSRATCVMACFDNEEVGSSTRQGADSQILSEVLERITISAKKSREDYFRALASSFIVSADGAHAVHPNMGAKTDPTSRPVLNGGVVVKISANKSYTSDAVSAAVFAGLCKKAGISVQKFVNRSDMRGGSTIGPISSTHVSIASVDVGIPMLAMHSIRETCGAADHSAMLAVLSEFFKS